MLSIYKIKAIFSGVFPCFLLFLFTKVHLPSESQLPKLSKSFGVWLSIKAQLRRKREKAELPFLYYCKQHSQPSLVVWQSLHYIQTAVYHLIIYSQVGLQEYYLKINEILININPNNFKWKFNLNLTVFVDSAVNLI